ncbi:carboxymuconolactone decarboxylase family protein [Actinocrispum wychmicini]|uniref:Putative peroxidase-related enzyme n=1 Tax=Actinocrispum wychmicini TaxID=1213861 RepID=A0A4R2J791_9PSEU|nr:peroxidase-related enzyme [Actinocrispum wychmicini]TCO54394.1 putative peroxidase-related enzyme [Actinocrispum wychmicini]
MTYLPSLPEDSKLLQVFRAYPATAKPLIAFHELVMREESPFTSAERELIAAYVSGVNACSYCHGVHTQTAEAFGVEAGLLAAALSDLDTAPVGDKLRPVLRYVGKLTATPSQVTQADADDVFAAGWDERALHDAVLVCALFNFMNRMVDGLGVRADAGYFAESGQRLRQIGYSGLLAMIE